MATGIAGSQQKQLLFGTTVVRAAALLPQTTTAAVFTIAGGRVLITTFVGDVAVVMPATANTVAVNGAPTTGTAVVWASAVSTASKEVGSQISLPGTVGGALVVANAGCGVLSDNVYVGNIGTITLTTTGSAATGTVRWSLTYVPLDPGATVVAA
jgi:hypothetical protein